MKLQPECNNLNQDTCPANRMKQAVHVGKTPSV